MDYCLRDTWENRDNANLEWLLVVLEESHLYIRNIRGSVAQNILRIASAGRNRQTRIMALCCDLALIDSAFIRLTQQRWHGKLGIEENAKRKFRLYYGVEWLNHAIKLDVGQFIYLKNDKLSLVKAECFYTRRRPINYLDTIQKETEKPSLLQRLLGRM